MVFTRYIGITIAVLAAVAFLLLISEFKRGAQLAQIGLVIAILTVALRHEAQIIAFFQNVEAPPES